MLSRYLPPFPKNRPLTVEDKKIVQNFCKNFPPYSDFNFTSMFVWDFDNKLMISQHNNNLILRFNDYLSDEHFYTVLGEADIDECLAALYLQSKKEGLNQPLKLIPQTVVDNIKNKHLFHISEDHDNHDYIYSIQNNSALKGKDYADYRKSVNRFRNHHHKQIRISPLSLNSISEINALLDVFHRWAKSQNRSWKEVESEYNTFNKLLAHRHILNLEIYGLFLDDQLVAFSINEIVDNEHVNGHFEKADTAVHRDIFKYIRYATMNELTKKGYTYFNGEQDLGVKGMREAKLLHRPVHFLKKYIVKYRD